MPGTSTYKREEIKFVLQKLLVKASHAEIQISFDARFGRLLSDNQVRYLTNKYGRHPDYNSPLINGKGEGRFNFSPPGKKKKKKRKRSPSISPAESRAESPEPEPEPAPDPETHMPSIDAVLASSQHAPVVFSSPNGQDPRNLVQTQVPTTAHLTTPAYPDQRIMKRARTMQVPMMPMQSPMGMQGQVMPRSYQEYYSQTQNPFSGHQAMPQPANLYALQSHQAPMYPPYSFSQQHGMQRQQQVVPSASAPGIAVPGMGSQGVLGRQIPLQPSSAPNSSPAQNSIRTTRDPTPVKLDPLHQARNQGFLQNQHFGPGRYDTLQQPSPMVQPTSAGATPHAQKDDLSFTTLTESTPTHHQWLANTQALLSLATNPQTLAAHTAPAQLVGPQMPIGVDSAMKSNHRYGGVTGQVKKGERQQPQVGVTAPSTEPTRGAVTAVSRPATLATDFGELAWPADASPETDLYSATPSAENSANNNLTVRGQQDLHPVENQFLDLSWDADARAFAEDEIRQDPDGAARKDAAEDEATADALLEALLNSSGEVETAELVA